MQAVEVLNNVEKYIPILGIGRLAPELVLLSIQPIWNVSAQRFVLRMKQGLFHVGDRMVTHAQHLNSTHTPYVSSQLPVMAAVAVRKKVVSIGHSSLFSVTEILLDQIKSNCMY